MNKMPNYLPLKIKCDILKQINAGTRATLLARKYNVARSTISSIKSKEAEILKCYDPMADKKGNRKRMRKSEHPKMEKALIEWLRAQELAGIKVTGNMIREQARLIHENIRENDKNFVASDGWIHRFKTRYKLLPSLEEIERRTDAEGKLMFFEEIKLQQTDDEDYNNVNNLLTVLQESPIDYNNKPTFSNAACTVKQEFDQLEEGAVGESTESSTKKVIGHAEAFDALTSLISWAKENRATVREINTLEKLRYVAEIKMNKT